MDILSRASGRRVLVTGASGFVGGRVVERLVGAGADVHGVCRTAQPPRDGVRWWQADLAEEAPTCTLIDAVAPEVILHLAGRPVAARDVAEVVTTFRSNLASTVNLLAAAGRTGGPRVVLTGSLEEPTDRQSDEVASSPYALSKWAARAYGRMFSELFALPVVTLRVFMVYGPTQRDLRKLVPYTILSFLRGEAPQLSSGQREVDWVYVDDVVDAYCAAALTPGLAGVAADVGSGQTVSIRDVVSRIAAVLGTAVEPQFGAVPDRPLEQVRVADLTTAASLGWGPRTSLDEGLLRTVTWYAEARRAGRIP